MCLFLCVTLEQTVQLITAEMIWNPAPVRPALPTLSIQLGPFVIGRAVKLSPGAVAVGSIARSTTQLGDWPLKSLHLTQVGGLRNNCLVLFTSFAKGVSGVGVL